MCNQQARDAIAKLIKSGNPFKCGTDPAKAYNQDLLTEVMNQVTKIAETSYRLGYAEAHGDNQ